MAIALGDLPDRFSCCILFNDPESLITKGSMDVDTTNVIGIEKIAGIFATPP